MVVRLQETNFRWEPVPFIQDKIQKVLDSWEGTPYSIGQCQKGIGVDCVRFVCSVYDELYGFTRSEYKRLPQDVALHNKEGAINSMKEIIGLYDKAESIDPDTTTRTTLQPGDALIVGPKNGGPGHCLIVGGKKNRVYHSLDPCVKWTGMKFFSKDQKLFRIYRMSDRDRWV